MFRRPSVAWFLARVVGRFLCRNNRHPAHRAEVYVDAKSRVIVRCGRCWEVLTGFEAAADLLAQRMKGGGS